MLLGAAVVIGLVVFVLYRLAAPPGLTWTHDEGDLAAAALTGGIPHPHGYPTYMLIARFMLWVGGFLDISPAVKLSVLSSGCGALSTGLLVWIAYRFAPPTRSTPLRILCCALAGFLYGTAALVWRQALIIEMYALANVFLFGSALLGLAIFQRLQDQKSVTPLTLVFGVWIGLGFGAHATTLFFAFFISLLVFFAHRRSIRLLPVLLVGLLLGLVVFLYLPLHAGRSPTSNWGDPSTPDGFLWMVTAAAYRPYLVWTINPQRIAYIIGLLAQDLRFPALFLAILGYWGLWDRWRGAAVAAVLTLVLNILFVTVYDVANIFAYLLPTFALLSIFVAGALIQAINTVLTLPTLNLPTQRFALGLLFLLITSLFGLSAFSTFERVSLRDNVEADRYGVAAIDMLPPNSVLFADEDRQTFTLWYTQAALGRLDVAVIEQRLLRFPWYRQTLTRFYPALTESLLRLPTPLVVEGLVRAGIPTYTAYDPARVSNKGVPDSVLYRVTPP